jgi:hypothetical protein
MDRSAQRDRIAAPCRKPGRDDGANCRTGPSSEPLGSNSVNGAKPGLDLIWERATDPCLAAVRLDAAVTAAPKLREAGRLLHLVGHIVGDGRVSGSSARGNGNDAQVAVGLLAQIGADLLDASATLLSGTNHYAGAALLRQVVEVEYLSWAFANEKREASEWLNSTHQKRLEFFTPARLRDLSDGRFLQLTTGTTVSREAILSRQRSLSSDIQTRPWPRCCWSTCCSTRGGRPTTSSNGRLDSRPTRDWQPRSRRHREHSPRGGGTIRCASGRSPRRRPHRPDIDPSTDGAPCLRDEIAERHTANRRTGRVDQPGTGVVRGHPWDGPGES